MRGSGSISFGFTAGAKKSQRRTGHHPRSHIKNVSKHYVPRSMKNFLQILPIALCGLAGTVFADDFKSMVITSGMSADLPPRSEERRVGKECRSRRVRVRYKK